MGGGWVGRRGGRVRSQRGIVEGGQKTEGELRVTGGLASDWQDTCLVRLLGPALAGPHLAGSALADRLHQVHRCGCPGRPHYRQVHWLPGAALAEPHQAGPALAGH